METANDGWITLKLGFCDQCALATKVVRIYDWFPSGGTIMPHVDVCLDCLEKIIRKAKKMETDIHD